MVYPEFNCKMFMTTSQVIKHICGYCINNYLLCFPLFLCTDIQADLVTECDASCSQSGLGYYMLHTHYYFMVDPL